LPSLSDPARFSSPAEHQFMDLYLIATSLHGLHLTIGIILMFVLAWRIHRRGLRLPGHAIVVETSGLYWHFVDVIWIFLYPVLYLAR
jgi:cytochrome c oxidase subunit 3